MARANSQLCTGCLSEVRSVDRARLLNAIRLAFRQSLSAYGIPPILAFPHKGGRNQVRLSPEKTSPSMGEVGEFTSRVGVISVPLLPGQLLAVVFPEPA